MDAELLELGNMVRERALREVPQEKAQAVLRQAQIARVLQKTGSLKMNGLGQKIAGIDRRLFMRWHQQYPGCWSDKGFIREFLRDNPDVRAPGFKHGNGVKPTQTIVYA